MSTWKYFFVIGMAFLLVSGCQNSKPVQVTTTDSNQSITLPACTPLVSIFRKESQCNRRGN